MCACLRTHALLLQGQVTLQIAAIVYMMLIFLFSLGPQLSAWIKPK